MLLIIESGHVSEKVWLKNHAFPFFGKFEQPGADRLEARRRDALKQAMRRRSTSGNRGSASSYKL
jgi:hypothetical protein